MIETTSKSIGWLKEISHAVEQFAREESPDTLIEFTLSESDRDRLYQEVGNLPPWLVSSRDHQAALSLAAVQAAADAEEGDEAYIRHFLERIGRTFDRASWDGEYGPATEAFFERHFGHTKSYGPWRYVRTVFKHAGIALVGMRAYAELLDALLAGGVNFTWGEYLREARRVGSTLIRPYLRTQAGFKFTRATGEYLRRHRRGELSLEQLEALRGYRSGFWPELLAHFRGEIGATREKGAPPPKLALDTERSYLVIRYDPVWHGRGVYRISGRSATYAEERVGGQLPTRVQIGNDRPAEVVPWWGPGQSSVAVFRAGDGVFLGQADPGGHQSWPLRGGSYLIVADQCAEAALEQLQAFPMGALDVLPQDDQQPAYTIWQVDLSPSTDYADLGLRTIGRVQAPSLAFRVSGHSHPLGAHVFADSLPAVEVRNWSDEASAEYAIRADLGGVPREVSVPPGCSVASLHVVPPCMGRIWVEPRGYTSASDALPNLEFCVLPAGVGLSVVERFVSEDEYAHVIATIPDGWRLRTLSPGVTPVNNNTWRMAPGSRVFDGVLDGPGLQLPVSLRLPLVRLESRTGAHLIWMEQLEAGAAGECDVDAPTFTTFDLRLTSDAGSRELARGMRRDGERGHRIRLRAFLDTFQTHHFVAGQIHIHIGERQFPQQLWLASVRQLVGLLDPWAGEGSIQPTSQTVATLEALPDVGSRLAELVGMLLVQSDSVRVSRLLRMIQTLDLPDSDRNRLLTAIADIAGLAEAFDGTRMDTPELKTSPNADALIRWLRSSEVHPPFPLDRIRIARWRRKATDLELRRNEDGQAEQLVREWRTAIRSGGESSLSTRPGGYALTDAARRYRESLELTERKLRNQALTLLIGSFARVQEEAPAGSIVSVLAHLLEQLACHHSGRRVDHQKLKSVAGPSAFCGAVAELIAFATSAPLPEYVTGLRLGDVSPSELDDALFRKERE